MERLHDQMAKKKKLLDNEMIESVTAQIELDKTAECFRRAHQERETLIEQWEQTIQQMRKRDQDMERCTNVSPPWFGRGGRGGSR
jgi:UDP-glucose:O-linked fucose beta-1,3-glucosyltransferase